jgi:hypothetical protein
LRTTKIIVEEASSSPTEYTFLQASRKSEFSVEEVESYSLNVDESLHSPVVETFESCNESISKSLCASRQISIQSVVSEDEKISHNDHNYHNDENDDDMESLFDRIKKQRSVLENILDQNLKETPSEETKIEQLEEQEEEEEKAENLLEGIAINISFSLTFETLSV